MIPEDFEADVIEAYRAYEMHIVCLSKCPDEFMQSMLSLMRKAIREFTNRKAGMRHGIALDPYVTVILSENGNQRPLCGIYFNLKSPYLK